MLRERLFRADDSGVTPEPVHRDMAIEADCELRLSSRT